MKTIRNIYNHLQDRESKAIFINRLLYSITDGYDYILQIIRALPQKSKLDDLVTFCREHADQMIFYGAGNDLLLLSNLYPDLCIQHICDRSVQKQQEGWHGIPVMSPDELLEMKDQVYVAITTSGFYEEIRLFLSSNGFKEERLIDLSMITDTERQYFEQSTLSPCPDEVFIDGGCFDGSTTRRFIRWCSGNYKKIYAFEPDKKNYERCLKMCEREQISDIQILHKGLWDHEARLTFQETGGQGSKIEERDISGTMEGDRASDVPDGAGGDVGSSESIGVSAAEETNVIWTAAIDDIVGEDKVTFIKLDVEGAELRALQGAELSIRRHRPRLAISIYHKPEDVIEIPAYILSLHEDYRLYIRHYQMSACETILYAV